MQNDLIDRLNDSESAFIREMDMRFPDRCIGANVDLYLAIPRALRLGKAWEKCQTTLRAGYVRRHLPPDVQQTLADHEIFVGKLAYHFAPLAVCAYHAQRAGEIHDTPEEIATDFTPHDPIALEEKNRLEDIAARILFDEYLYKIWREHEDGQSPVSKWVQDCDLLERCLHIVSVIERRYPDLSSKVDVMFLEIDPRLQTEQGKAIYQWLLRSRTQQHETGISFGVVEAIRYTAAQQLRDNFFAKVSELRAISHHVTPRIEFPL